MTDVNFPQDFYCDDVGVWRLKKEKLAELEKPKPTTNVIRKNCMEEIANIYGLKLCEDFMLESDSGYTIGVFKIDKCGLWKYDKNNMCYYAWHDVINRILDGSWGVRKMTNEEIVKMF